MPYVSQSIRDDLDAGDIPATAGELNYVLTMAIKRYMEGQGCLSYTVINDIVGALEGCKLEFYRRVAEPYENEKIKSNGDVY